MKKLPVSVIIPSYNRAHTVVRAIKSALEETYGGDEIIVIDDGSTDETEKILLPFFTKIRYFCTENQGAGAARNFGVRIAQNPLIAFLDSDDEWFAGKLELQRKLHTACPDLTFSFTDFAVQKLSGEQSRNHLKYWHKDARAWEKILGLPKPYTSIATLPENFQDFDVYFGSLYLSELSANYVFTSTLVVNKAKAGDALLFGEDLPLYEDLECFARLAQIGKAAFLDIETAWQHAHTGPRLTDQKSYERATAQIKLIERVWGRDKNFLCRHRDKYEQVLKKHRLIRAKALISLGKTGEARNELNLVDQKPLYLFLLSLLPSWFVKGLFRFRRAIF